MVTTGQAWSRVVSNTICSLFQASKCLKCVFIRPRLRKLQSTEDIGSGRAWSSMVKHGQEWSRVVARGREREYEAVSSTEVAVT